MRRLFSSPKKTSEGRHSSKERARKFGGLKRSKSSKVIVEDEERTLSSSYWDDLPVEIQISIFVECSVYDFLPLKLVCRGFYEVLTRHELVIAQEYLRRRRHDTLPSTIDHERTYTMNPEDDVVLLSDLFPPTKSARGGYLYTFRYLHTLRRRQDTCARLSYYLANRVMDRFFDSNQTFVKGMSASKSERDLMFEHGIAHLKFNFIPLTDLRFRTKGTFESFIKRLRSGKAPRTHPSERQTEFVDPTWIGGLLTASGLGRVVEYFSAEIGDGVKIRTRRRDFMINFEKDIDRYVREEMHPYVYVLPPSGQPHYPTVHEVWLDAAIRELRSRDAIPHDPGKLTIWNGAPMLMACDNCLAAEGWTIA
ncbi:F-box domain protein [Talaromyces stipitatus ATCC 10500]|uniref:F-box domain protein n=1 Tax=Talaromyces stipitatus (strain ATCC 10500 / CBS 375.48 / QM 6759 / NRRL 1006) TaxID=441959 RepID=B8M587_TALSN|nr:F-box domain protein [Talaromyces stipitatus ATCC 10500]EED19693.1 F-box domain protein [Talaromyces stipitatus ATCC 10500]